MEECNATFHQQHRNTIHRNMTRHSQTIPTIWSWFGCSWWWLVVVVLVWSPTATTTTTAATTTAKTIVVTGAAGFVGSHVADYLLHRGDKVIIVDEVNDYYNVSLKRANLQLLIDKYQSTNRLSIYETDICNVERMDEILQQHQPVDALVHLAARAGVRPSILNPYLYVHSNVLGTVQLLELSVKYQIPNVVFASSSSVYGGSSSDYFSETEPVDRPISPYAATKKSCELFAHVYSQQFHLNVTGLRFFTVYGPRGRPDMAPFLFIDRISRSRPIQQFGNGTSSRDYTYIDDIVKGVVAAVDTGAEYKILNLGKGSGTVLTEFVSLVEEFVGQPAIVEQLPDQPGDVPRTCANVSEAYRHLHYNATVPFREGIAQTVQWYKTAYPQSNRRRRLGEWEEDYNDDQRPQERRLSNASPPVKPHTDPKRVLVTGGNGFVGQHVVQALLDRGDTVIVVDLELDNLSEDVVNVHPNLMLHQGDIVDGPFLEAVFAKTKPEWVVHLAGETDNSFHAPVRHVRNNVEGTLRLLDVCKEHSVKNLVLASSDSVYGIGQAVWKPSDRVDSPLTPFAASKKTAELIAYTYHHLYKVPVNVLRFFPIFGPRYPRHSEVFQVVDQLLSNPREPSRPFRLSRSDFLHVDDAVNGVLQALDRIYGYEIFNIGSGTDNALEFIQQASRGAQGAAVQQVISQAAALHSRANIDKAKHLLDFQPRTNLQEETHRTTEWHKKNNYRPPFTATNYNSPNRASGKEYRKSARLPPEWIRNLFCLQWMLVGGIIIGKSYWKVSIFGGSLSKSRPSTPTSVDGHSVAELPASLSR